MLERVKKTPSKLDDVFVLALGFLTFGPLAVRLIGLVEISFQYYEVGAAAVAGVFAIVLWVVSLVRWLKHRQGGFSAPQPMISLLLVFSVYHFLDIYTVRGGLIIENQLAANVWLFLVSYAISAVLLDSYIWVASFFGLLIWAGAEVVDFFRSWRRAFSETKSDLAQGSEAEPDETIYERPAIVPRPAPPMPELEDEEVDMARFRPSLEIEATEDLDEQLLDGAAAGNSDDLEILIQRLQSLEQDELRQILLEGIPEFAVDRNVLPGIYSDPEKLAGVFSHQAYRNNPQQRTSFLEALAAAGR
jgi:hypothetical protein